MDDLVKLLRDQSYDEDAAYIPADEASKLMWEAAERIGALEFELKGCKTAVKELLNETIPAERDAAYERAAEVAIEYDTEAALHSNQAVAMNVQSAIAAAIRNLKEGG